MMTGSKVLIADKLASNGVDVLKDCVEVDNRPGISSVELLQSVAQYDAMIVRSRTKVTPEVLQAGLRLKVVGRAGVGVDNIDLNEARARGVIVVNSPTATTRTVAEHTVGMMFSLAKFFPRADRLMKQGEWAKKQLRGVELCGKMLGIIGVGRIGKEVGRLANAIGMTVIGYDPWVSDEEMLRIGIHPASRLHEVYQQADYITLHVPLTAETRGLIDMAAFEQMKPGVRLICTARGGVLDEQALLAALETGRVAGAALDVFAQEPPGQTPLVTHEHIIATPHIGAQTVEAQERVAYDIATEVLRALQGKPHRWRVA